jgi:hypothetical protein
LGCGGGKGKTLVGTELCFGKKRKGGRDMELARVVFWIKNDRCSVMENKRRSREKRFIYASWKDQET